MLKAITVSDFHIGSRISNTAKILSFLEDLPECEYLILNGDILDNCDIRLNKQSWKILSKLRKIAEKQKVVWVLGNHDYQAENIAHLIGVDFVEQFILPVNNKKILFMHGDEFDNFVNKRKILTKAADKLYRFIQRFSKTLALKLKKGSKKFLRNSYEVEKNAKLEMLKQHCSVICCGHTHLAKQGDCYLNSGCWTDFNGTYIQISSKGEAKLCFFD